MSVGATPRFDMVRMSASLSCTSLMKNSSSVPLRLIAYVGVVPMLAESVAVPLDTPFWNISQSLDEPLVKV